MHPLDTSTFMLHEFQGSAIPYYAILSHRWESEEVSFRDLQSGKGRDMVGFRKIKGCCAQAVTEGWKYVWIDSCCIDKSSSAELSEAINSMFRWYKDAQVCYAYLSDVPEGDGDPSAAGSAFRNSKWFTRCWTLQELLAPSRVVFYNHDWTEIGTKSSLCDVITFVTGIKPLANHQDASVAQKMSWASRRETTREEDMAYCLMGLFGVNMPPLYGEGENSFMKLQLEILNKSDDESIFAWREIQWSLGGLLARSPAAFRESGDIRKATGGASRSPFTMTNKGLRIELSLMSPRDDRSPGFSTALFMRFHSENLNIRIAPLSCFRKNGSKHLAITLEKMGEERWCRRINELQERNGTYSSEG